MYPLPRDLERSVENCVNGVLVWNDDSREPSAGVAQNQTRKKKKNGRWFEITRTYEGVAKKIR